MLTSNLLKKNLFSHKFGNECVYKKQNWHNDGNVHAYNEQSSLKVGNERDFFLFRWKWTDNKPKFIED